MIEDQGGEVKLLKLEARRWVDQLVSGEATTADAEALKGWRQQSPAHEAAFAEAIHLWKSLGPGGQMFVAKRGMPVWPQPRAHVGRRALLGGGIAAIAASAAAYVVFNPPLNLWPSLDELKADYRTATGEQRRLTVADTAIEMNTQTSLSIPAMAGDAVRVHLISGEASFAMSPQSATPLIVSSGDGRVVASRGRFDVRNLGTAVCVTCLDGEVQVERDGKAALVTTGRQLSYDQKGFGQAVSIDAGEVISWQDGFIVFRYTPLSAAIVEINRYRPGRVILLNAGLGQKLVSGRFRIARAGEILAWIAEATGAKSRSLPGGVVLLS
jgi:transmembrane sensor